MHWGVDGDSGLWAETLNSHLFHRHIKRKQKKAVMLFKSNMGPTLGLFGSKAALEFMNYSSLYKRVHVNGRNELSLSAETGNNSTLHTRQRWMNGYPRPSSWTRSDPTITIFSKNTHSHTLIHKHKQTDVLLADKSSIWRWPVCAQIEHICVVQKCMCVLEGDCVHNVRVCVCV